MWLRDGKHHLKKAEEKEEKVAWPIRNTLRLW